MSVRRVPIVVLLFLSSLLIQVSSTEDIYWEGHDESNEFLEVKDENVEIGGRLKRLTQDYFNWNFFSSPTTTPSPLNFEAVTGDDDDMPDDRDDMNVEGSGFPDRTEPELKEKTLRVTFVVMEPYSKEYSSRDSLKFQTFSKTLADAVNALYEGLPGTQIASLVRIQSRISDELTCKVTLDIVTTGYYDLKAIEEKLKNHIQNNRALGHTQVSIDNFSATVIDKETIDVCSADEFKCEQGECVVKTALCDGTEDCSNGLDEADCPVTECRPDEIMCTDGRCLSESARCDGKKDCSDGLDETSCPITDNQDPEWQQQLGGSEDSGNGFESPNQQTQQQETHDDIFDQNETTTPFESLTSVTATPQTYETSTTSTYCPPGYFNCDENRCLPQNQVCDGVPDCFDRKDEEDCGKSCGFDDFKCNNGKCIRSSQRCDRVVDCPTEEDEQNCTCTSDEFRCVSDGSCIETRKRCDSVNHCKDGSDEADCGLSCPPGLQQCPGPVFRCAERCDTTRECEEGEDCDECNHQCDNRCLEDSRICDGKADCSDGSDESDCALCDGPNDFRCLDGVCLNVGQRCNGVPECSDESDEENCDVTVTSVPVSCPEGQFLCENGNCIDEQFVCDGHRDCLDNSDEIRCQTICPEGQFSCRDGTCIDNQFVCDRNQDCADNSDEINCRCEVGEWQCNNGRCIPDSNYCDGDVDCEDASDEDGCPSRPLPTPFPTAEPPNRNVCEPEEFQCSEGKCLPAEWVCDGEPDCTDQADEQNCSPTVPSVTQPAFPDTTRQSVPDDETTERITLKLRTYPDQQSIRYGGDVVFQCRDESQLRAPVRWIRQDARPLPPGFTDRNGRLEMFNVTARDSGVYICQAPKYLAYPDAQVRVTLTVEPAPVTQRPVRFCRPDEATCGNGQCISKSAVCNGIYDCSDRSDEDSCNLSGQCEPNSFQCDNRKCVLKTWLCDSEDDCGDNSDEQNCGTSAPGQPCSPREFACAKNNQCIPKSFHCDDQSDCMDGSDEIGCAPVHVTRPPQPSNVKLNPGDTLILECQAVGVPTPLITWRFNWKNVPEKCTSTSENGVGILTCPDMQAEDSGAYSCEAINNKGTTFATPDSIVFVDKSDICRNGYFNSEARSENECIRCFCFGESTQCRSADLFTYNMPTPLGEGGTRLVGVTSNGDVQPINDQYYYQSLRNGATITKLATYDTRDSNTSPYLTLPDYYNGNQLTSYGGHIRYQLSPQTQRFDGSNNKPDIIIKGKYQNLEYISRQPKSRNTLIEAQFVPGEWWKTGPRGNTIATREDIMMALDNVEMILLRADFNDAGVNITDFVMESAQSINIGLGAASLVEECTCPPGYEGLSCQKCAAGYVREKSGPWLGNCVLEQKPCPPGTYGDPNSGYACLPCPCPLTNRENQFARTCYLSPRGVVCDCQPGYEGSNCEVCAPGYTGNPLLLGDSCKPEQLSNCNTAGTSSVIGPDECECKENVQGTYCDQCKADSFYLSEDNDAGCALCFCSGVSQQCTSSYWRRKTISTSFNVPQIVDQVRLYNSVPYGRAGAVAYNQPIETELRPSLLTGEIAVTSVDLSRPTIYYWSLPASFAGDKVTSYGGTLQYALKHVQSTGGASSTNNAADIQIISDNRLTFHYFGNFVASSDGYLNASVQLTEKGWQRADGNGLSREHFLLALADVKTILVKATYTTNTQVASLVSASIETAAPDGTGSTASQVEQCVCPTGYVGTSCEDCAPGYTRSASGLYLKHCAPCNCSGKSNMCHPENGICIDCGGNTMGDDCGQCKPGYERDSFGNCEPSYQPRPDTCNCDERGVAAPCYDGYCQCKENVEGNNCDRCRPGTFGLDGENPLGCTACYCSGVTTDCHEAIQYSRIPIPAPIIGNDYGGFRLTSLNDDVVVEENYVAATNESELMYIFPTETRVDGDLFWSLPGFSGNRIQSYGGKLIFTQTFQTGGYPSEAAEERNVILVGDQSSIYWNNPSRLRSGETKVIEVVLHENGWYLLDSATPANRYDIMSVLKNLQRVLVRATLSPYIVSSAIADVSMDSAIDQYTPGAPPAKGVEVCMCPEGFTGTSCEDCSTGYYHDVQGYCRKCNCNGHECQLGSNNEVVCFCRPPYTGPDCSTLAGVPDTTDRIPTPPAFNSTVIVRITSPAIMIKEIGSTVNFTCSAQSRMTFNQLPVVWRKSEGVLPQGRSQVDQTSGVLIITNLQISDSGKYICQTNDGVSIMQAEATLIVPGNSMTIPQVKIEQAIQENYEGERVELECTVSGNPTPTITWQRAGNRPLPLYVNTFDSFLVIDSARIEDAGEYRCIASNPAGTREATAMVDIRPRPSEPSDKLSVTPTSRNVYEGQSTHVVCTGTTNIPAGAIGWTRQDGVEFETNVRSDNGVLYIDVARLENQGVYICQTSAIGVNPIPVLVTVQPLSTPPPSERSNITVSVDSLTIPTGETGTVDCNPHGYPLPLIRWRKYDGAFGPSTSQRGNTLIVSNAQDSDKGYYVCEGEVAGNPNQIIYVYIDIEKREAPIVEIWPQEEHRVRLGTQYEIQCRVQGYPDPVVTWNRNGNRPLSPSTQILQDNILRFENVDVNDEGEYICTGSNSAGSSSGRAILKVRQEPEITITPNNYLEVGYGDQINLECRARGYPQPLVSIKLNNREVVPPALEIAALRVPYATENEDGEYTCTATNDAGTIEELFAIRVTRGDGGGYGGDEGSGENEIDVNPSPSPDRAPSSMLAIEGQEAYMDCNTPDGSEARWGRINGQPLQPNAQQIGNRLIIRNVSKSDSGQYECTLYNIYGGGAERVVYTNVRVVTAPRITLRPPTQTVYPGQSPTVECIVDGDDIQDITWAPVGRPLSRRVEIRQSTLIFHQIEVEDAGKYECFAITGYANASNVAEVIVSGNRPEPLVSIDQPGKEFKAGENVTVVCRMRSGDTKIHWERVGTNQYVDSREFNGGSMLVIVSVQEADVGVYRCIGSDLYGRTSYDEFSLDVDTTRNYPDREPREYLSRLRSAVDLPCFHNLEPPVKYEWSKELQPLSPEIRTNESTLHLDNVLETDGGTYVCRVRNYRTAIEARAIVRVMGVVPRFDGDSWVALPKIRDVYRQFVIEISFRPADHNGLIMYSSENQGRQGDFISLQLVEGVPIFMVQTDERNLIVIEGNKPLQLNVWHTVRINRINNKVTMDVDNSGPFINDSTEQWDVLKLEQPLYIGGVPDYQQLPSALNGAAGFIGCVSMLIIGKEEKKIMLDKTDSYNVKDCDNCAPNLCLNGGICQEAPVERGYICLCPAGFAGPDCGKRGSVCRSDLCGPGQCIETPDGYRCNCPGTYTGKNCETQQYIEYPAFTGSAFLAIKTPKSPRILHMSMRVKAASPVTDGIIMYCAESSRGYGGFTSLIVRNSRLEFRYDIGDGSGPVVATGTSLLMPKEWTEVNIARIGADVSLTIKSEEVKVQLPSSLANLNLNTPMFVGGVDESIVLNNNTGVAGGFFGCIKDVKVYGTNVNLAKSSIIWSNVQECSDDDRGDIPENEQACRPGSNDPVCERILGACSSNPCLNQGTCQRTSSRQKYRCDCPLGFTGINCQIRLELLQSVGFEGNGYLELPSSLLRYDRLYYEPALIALAINTNDDGILLYQREQNAPVNSGDYILIRVDQGQVTLDLDMGGGLTTLKVENVFVNDGLRHSIVVSLHYDGTVSLTVDGIVRNGTVTGFSSVMNADSNIYIGGMPNQYNINNYTGMNGCFEQIELMGIGRSLNLGRMAVRGRNTRQCREP